MAGEHILIVDDDPFTVELLTEALDEQGFLPQSAPDGKGAREALNRREFRVAIFDLSLPDLEGMELVREVNQSSPDTAIIILTGYPTLDSSIEALRQGAFDYLIKPFKVPEVIATIQKALNDHSLKAEITGLRSRVRELEQELRRYQEGAPMPPPGRPAGPGASPAAGGYGGFPRGPRTG